MQHVQVNLSDMFIPFLGQIKSGKTTDEKVALSLATGMYLSKHVTMAKAPELANMNIWAFVDALKSQSISWGEYTNESFLLDELALSKLVNEQSDL